MAEETSLREDIEAAFADFEGDDEKVVEAAPEPAPEPSEPEPAPEPTEAAAPAEEAAASSEEPSEEPTEPEEGARRRDAKGRFLPDEAHPQDKAQYPNLTAARIDTAPEGWRPAAREGWSELPESIRREIHRREIDIATGLQGASDARSHLEQFQRTVTPFQPVLAAQGINDPMEAVGKLLNTAATLQMGSSEQKAERVAGLIQHYGVDLEALDRILSAQIKGEAPAAAPAVDPALDARLKPLETFIEGLNGRLQTAEQQQAAETEAEIAKFQESAEFMADVRLDMADLLEVAANRGRTLSLQDAYDMACNMNPEIRAVLARRQHATATATETERTAAKREAAAASVRAPQTGSMAAPAGNGSLRDDILRAIETVEEAR